MYFPVQTTSAQNFKRQKIEIGVITWALTVATECKLD